ncbi:hypothetical protein BMI_II620 [Brucella microti CCM 4915]|uniref:Uncharacterized protein n=5 Tax=Brucella TaxID=234 RepID=A9MBR1_BRUC2|nr:Hypothetical protein, conserved [Brucella canis ATCC 23365]ABY39606.1 Hypothetical protein, conserved [Brucella suis ATCC 23445]ACU49747.1 hypothetical protein BMI_II620 [Brucella microti CCM 4915]AEK56104.1 hypothetical protein BPI_II678 [Brucella pinnipedialis B2/94]EEH12659.1 Hypothetical protein, conserved [Brucella ceti str. Cudo]
MMIINACHYYGLNLEEITVRYNDKDQKENFQQDGSRKNAIAHQPCRALLHLKLKYFSFV